MWPFSVLLLDGLVQRIQHLGGSCSFPLGRGGEVATSDGEVRHFSPGGILLVEDTRGKGYSSRVGGETYGMAAIVQLAS